MGTHSNKAWHDYGHMVFDIDGTLLNSNIAHVWSWQDAIEAEHLFFPHITLFIQMGLPGKHIIEKFSTHFPDDETAQRIAKASGEIYADRYVNLVAPFDGVYDLLGKLKAREKKLYAITSASKKESDPMLERFKLDKYFELVLTSEEVRDGKPSAEPFIRLKEKLGVHVDMISFGDSPYDFKASKVAGVPFVYLGHGGFPREWFAKAKASFFSIKQMLETLPKANTSRHAQREKSWNAA